MEFLNKNRHDDVEDDDLTLHVTQHVKTACLPNQVKILPVQKYSPKKLTKVPISQAFSQINMDYNVL